MGKPAGPLALFLRFHRMLDEPHQQVAVGAARPNGILEKRALTGPIGFVSYGSMNRTKPSETTVVGGINRSRNGFVSQPLDAVLRTFRLVPE